ncbi:hypothetical protein GUITHDRAFT_45716, partial [Guillardia theta CCMP2712]
KRTWNQHYCELILFKQQHGHCNVPQKRFHDLSLSNWVAWQRAIKRRNTMRKDRELLLDELGLHWSWVKVRHDYWNERYSELLRFKLAHGHCNVPRRSELGSWVSWMRQRRNKG